MTRLIVFTDLDGTLLDHETYAWEAAVPALEALRDADVPLVLASSKTAAEIAPLRAELGFAGCPAIVENGAGVLEPGDDGTGKGEDYRRLRRVLDDMPARLRSAFQGFGDWSTAEVARRTGLSHEQAALAKQRRFSEPGIFTGDDAAFGEFGDWLAARGITIRRGGRFISLSFGADKVRQMSAIGRLLQAGGAEPIVLALGDAPNDIAMLEAADIGIVVANPHGPGIAPLAGEGAGAIRRTQLSGPAGWNEAVLSLLNQFGIGGGRRAATLG